MDEDRCAATLLFQQQASRQESCCVSGKSRALAPVRLVQSWQLPASATSIASARSNGAVFRSSKKFDSIQLASSLAGIRISAWLLPTQVGLNAALRASC